MNRSHTVTLLAASLISISTFAATDSSRSETTTSQTKLESSARKNLVTLQLLGVSSKLSETFQGQSASVSGNSAVAGISAGMESMISDQFSVEGNLAALQKKFDTFNFNGQSQKTNGDASMKVNTARLTGMGRYHIIPAISVGAGAYASQFVGPAKSTSETGEKSNESMDGIPRLDYGAAFGARGELPIASNVSFVVDARYFLGLRDLNNPTNPNGQDLSIKTRDIEVAAGAGIRF